MSEFSREEINFQEIRAAALKYSTDKDQAPVVVAAGGGYIAGKILEIADECGVAIYHDDSAATLLSRLNLGQEIPPELYQMVVDIYTAIITASDAIKQEL